MPSTEVISVTEFRAMQQKQIKTKHKYGAKPKTVDGQRFPSTREADRYTDLRLMENAGEITGLSTQVRFILEGGRYIADFVYYDCRTRAWVVEDVKGYRTPAFRRAKKAMKERYGIEVVET